jgi:hypothetical protein
MFIRRAWKCGTDDDIFFIAAGEPGADPADGGTGQRSLPDRFIESGRLFAHTPLRRA